MSDIEERIAEALHGLRVEAPVGALNGRDARKIAATLVSELGLYEQSDDHQWWLRSTTHSRTTQRR